MEDTGRVNVCAPQERLGADRSVAVVRISNAPVNALSPSTLASLADGMRALQEDPGVRAVVITGQAHGEGAVSFSAGFDITSLRRQQREGRPNASAARANDILNELVEGGPKPVVAAVNGLALGGGCEVAMACAARVGVPEARLGLPELTLGIVPGFGGTQRLPRLVGVEAALKAMLTSKPMAAPRARAAGLLDEVVPADALLLEAARVALEIADGRRARRYTLLLEDRLPAGAEQREAAAAAMQFAREQAKKKQPNLEHPGLCIDAVAEGVARGAKRGLEREKEVFQRLLFSPASRALVHVFLAQRGTGRLPGARGPPRRTSRAAVIGGGLMGSGIATAMVLAGVEVLLKEINQAALDAGVARVRANLASAVKKGRLAPAAAEAAVSLLRGTLDYEQFGGADVVIEAVIESIPLKQRIFADLERVCRPDAILATNTSTINIDLVAQKLRPETRARVCGAHFFSPAHVMPLFEIIRTESTDVRVLADTVALGKRIKKTPVVVGNCTGFAVNRVFFPYTMAACMLVDAGADPYAVDDAVKSWGMPMGPFRLTDLVGGDIGLHVAQSYVRDFGERVYESRLIPLMNDAKRLGEKTGSGFYSFAAGRGRAARDAADIAPLLRESRGRAGLPPECARAVAAMSAEEMVEVVMFPVVNEACRVLHEGIVDSAGDLDVCAVLGMGFPPYRGGVLHWADGVGAARIRDRLLALRGLFRGTKDFFTPCAYLETCAQGGLKLSARGTDGDAARPRL